VRHAVLASLIIVAAAGCATLQAAGARSTEKVLGAAGFHIEAADTVEKTAELEALPARKLIAQTRDGKTAYVYRDPGVCHCLYVGGEPEYQQYQKLRLEQAIADDEMDPWGTWSGWGWRPNDGDQDSWPPWP